MSEQTVTIEFLGCIRWQGSVDRNGYGVISTGKRKRESAHRLAYEKAFGPIPDGKHIHHVCRNKLCVNPIHLLALAQKDHNLLHQTHENGAGFHRGKTHCPHGHPYDEENTYHSTTQRHCRICHREAVRRHRAKRG